MLKLMCSSDCAAVPYCQPYHGQPCCKESSPSWGWCWCNVDGRHGRHGRHGQWVSRSLGPLVGTILDSTYPTLHAKVVLSRGRTSDQTLWRRSNQRGCTEYSCPMVQRRRPASRGEVREQKIGRGGLDSNQEGRSAGKRSQGSTFMLMWEWTAESAPDTRTCVLCQSIHQRRS